MKENLNLIKQGLIYTIPQIVILIIFLHTYQPY